MPIDNNQKASRKLPFDLRDVISETPPSDNSGVITHITPDMFPANPDEQMLVVFKLSLNEFVTLASSIDVGRDIAYGEQSYEVWRLWCKALMGEIMVNCEDIADCIDQPEVIEKLAQIIINNQTIINAVTVTVNDNGFGNPSHINPYLTTAYDKNPPNTLNQEVKPLPTCNLDALWAGLREGIVRRMDDNGRDMLEDLAVIADVAQRMQVFIDIVPVMGDLVEALALQITEIIPDMLNIYDSYSSEATMDEIACDLFSLVCAECRYPTFEEIFEYYASNAFPLTPDLNGATLNAIAEILLDLITEPAKVGYFTIQVWQLFVLATQSVFNGFSGTASIVNMATLGEDSENNNWIQLCETCGETYAVYTWDFKAQGILDSYLDTADGNSADEGQFQPGLGWKLTNFSTGQVAEFCVPLDASWEIRAIAYKYSTGTTWQSEVVSLRPTPGSVTGATGINMSTGTGEYQRCRDALVSVTGYKELAIRMAIGTQTGASYIEKVAIVFNQSHAKPASVPTNDATLCS